MRNRTGLKREEEFKRYEFPIVENPDGQDNSVEPFGEIYSGMLKRTARETGHFEPENIREVESD
jgi:hypothetical protein